MQEVEKAKKELEEKKESYKKLKRECQKQKKWIAEYQLLMRAGASGQHKVLNMSLPRRLCFVPLSFPFRSSHHPLSSSASSFFYFHPFPLPSLHFLPLSLKWLTS